MQALNKGSMVIIDETHIFLPLESDYKDKLLVYLSRGLGKKVTINKIKEDLRLAYGYLHSTIHKLEAEKIVNIEEVGNYKLISLNFKNMLTIAELARVSVKISQEITNKTKQLKKLNSLVAKLRKYKDILSIVLFGSQARLEAREKSDIDILIILSERSPKNREIVNKIKSEIRAFETKEFVKMQEFIVDFEMLKRMLESKEEINVGKEALKDGIILDGFENYWKIVGEALG